MTVSTLNSEDLACFVCVANTQSISRAALETLDVPTLLITGEVDVALPPKRAREYADLFPHAQLVVQPGAGHFPWLDDPEAFAAAVQRIP